MRVFSHPLRIDPDGSFTTVEQGSARQAQQVAIAIVSTSLTERPLAPDFGIFDPVAQGITRAEIAAAVDLCEPDLTVVDVAIDGPANSRQSVAVTVAWLNDEEL